MSGQGQTREIIEHNFTYHDDPAKAHLYQTLRAKGKELAIMIEKLSPGSREQSLALTNLEQSIMWVNAAIARYPIVQDAIIETP